MINDTFDSDEIPIDFAHWKYIFTSEEIANYGSPHYGEKNKDLLIKTVKPKLKLPNRFVP